MRTKKSRWGLRSGVGFALAALLLVSNAEAATRRILLVGDSWPMFMWSGYQLLWTGRAFQETLIEKGYGQWEEWGYDTAIGGSLARQWAENQYVPGQGLGTLDLLRRELQDNPTIDIVHISIGGNDYLRGDYSDILGDPKFNHGWKKEWGVDSPEEIAFFDAIAAQVRVVVETCLEVRPDVRVAVCDYDYMYDDAGGGTIQETNEAGTRLGQRKLAMTRAVSADPRYLNRSFFINPYGLMQWTYGYPNPVAYGSQAVYGPLGQPGTGGTIQPPGGYPAYTPFLGGDIQYPIPRIAVLDGIHLNKTGYWTLARYCIDQLYGGWLDLPKVLAVVPSTPYPWNPNQVFNPTGLRQVAFDVTFSRAVDGVAETDFAVVMHGGLAGASVAQVDQGKDGATYVVTVNTGSGEGSLGLAVLDHDTIRDTEGHPLGGDGLNNGYFAYGGSYDIRRAFTLPVAAWPLFVGMLAAGFAAVRRSRRGSALLVAAVLLPETGQLQ